MKRIFILALGILLAMPMVYSQKESHTENFDGSNSFVASSASAWKIDTIYYVSGHNSIRGIVPNMPGDSIVLTSQIYDLSDYEYVLLRFNHICKVSPFDISWIEYRTNKGGGGMSAWEPLSTEAYLGKVNLNTNTYGVYGFNANSYPEWDKEDSLALPNQSWWQEELFDIGTEVGLTQFQIRFVLKHGDIAGTQISYGWLLDSIEIIYAPYSLTPPVVEFIEPLVKDTIYSVGPHLINAKVKTQTIAQIEPPHLIYTATQNETVLENDTIPMTMIAGDSLWQVTIPQFPVGSKIVYSLTGVDITGNTESISSGYLIMKSALNYGDTSVALTAILSPGQGQIMGNTATPIEIILKNRGDSALTSATIYLSVNGVISSHPWTGNLAWDFEQQFSLGTYTPRMEGYDTIVIWIENPNGVPDVNPNDDTLSIITYGCSPAMSGTYTVGQGGTFPTLKDAFDILNVCSATGDITLALKSGVYTELWELSDISNFMGNNVLTITSEKANMDSVILRPPSGAGSGIILSNTNNIRIEKITVDAIQVTHGIQFTGNCSNVVITHCYLLSDTSASILSNRALIIKGTVTGIADDITITHNIINGGYSGIYFFPGTGASLYGSNLIIDSNTLRNQTNYGLYIYYADGVSITNNMIASRTSEGVAPRYWTAMTLSDCNGTITANRIRQRNNNITSPYGITIQNFNSKNTTDIGLVANNEIILNMTTAYVGIYVLGVNKMKVLQNSIYISGSTAASGISISNNANNNVMVKNNNIYMTSTAAYPIYLNSVANVNLYDIDYNNMYAPTNVGYAGGAKANMTLWQQAIPSDLHSTREAVSFIDNTVDLKLSNYSSVTVPIILDANKDIENKIRSGAFTAMGCYHGLLPYTINATMESISGFREGSVLGQEDTIKIRVFNTGQTNLTTVTVNWSINNTVQSQTGITWTGTLLPEQSISMTLGTIKYLQGGNHVVKAWIANIGMTDEDLRDDTISVSGDICASAFNGTYIIGNGTQYPSLNAVMEQIIHCGVSGDVVFEFTPGTYTIGWDLTGYSLWFGTHSLTITSSTHNAASVIFVTAGAGITLSQINNIIIKDITINAIAGTSAIQFTGACTNVVIRDCILISDTASASGITNKYIIYKGTNTGVVNDISIIHNVLNGGNTAINFNAGTGTTVYGNNIVIDSNIFRNQQAYGVFVNYADAVKVSNNIVTSRTTGTSASWTCLYVNTSNGNITSNRIIQKSNAITRPIGIQIQNLNTANTTDTGIVANNEIILNSTNNGQGIYVYISAKAKIVHNSVYIAGTSDAATGIQIVDNANNYIMVKNNNIMMTSSQAYPIHINSIANLHCYDMDWNNMYAPQFVGFVETAKTNIVAWQMAMRTDKNSISIDPGFIDNTASLEVSDYFPLHAFILPEVSNDIENEQRLGVFTAMGCYHGFQPYTTNATLSNIDGFRYGAVLGEQDAIKVQLFNTGTTTLTNVTLNWSLSVNGNEQSQTGMPWTGSLLAGKDTLISMGTIDYLQVGNYTLKIWIANAGATQDYLKDDTISVSGYICSSPVSGSYTIGNGGQFASLDEFMERAAICGVNGDVVLEFLSDDYNTSLNLINSSALFGNYTLTITSNTHHAEDVIFVTNSVGIILSKSNNLVIKDITVNASAGTSAIQFTGACDNVLIRDCIFLSDTASTANNKHIIYKATNTGVANNISIISNLLQGGYSGITFYAGPTTAIYGANIIIDSNIISKQYNVGINSQQTNFTRISHNTISSRMANTTANWSGITTTFYNGEVTANRIYQRSNNITAPYGITTQYFNAYYTTDTGIIANNEIILNIATTSARAGISISSTKAKIVHNSIYVSGTTVARGINVSNSTSNYLITLLSDKIFQTSL